MTIRDFSIIRPQLTQLRTGPERSPSAPRALPMLDSTSPSHLIGTITFPLRFSFPTMPIAIVSNAIASDPPGPDCCGEITRP
jgi:hypothetical protein